MVLHKVSVCIETERETVLYSKQFVQVWPAICPREEAIFVTSQKCPYHVIFDHLDLDLDLEHRPVWGPWYASLVAIHHLSGRRSDLRKMFTDRRTTDAARLH